MAARRAKRTKTIRDAMVHLTRGENLLDLCQRASVPYHSTRRWLRGELVRDDLRRGYKVEYVEALAKALGLTISIDKKKRTP